MKSAISSPVYDIIWVVTYVISYLWKGTPHFQSFKKWIAYANIKTSASGILNKRAVLVMRYSEVRR